MKDYLALDPYIPVPNIAGRLPLNTLIEGQPLGALSPTFRRKRTDKYFQKTSQRLSANLNFKSVGKTLGRNHIWTKLIVPKSTQNPAQRAGCHRSHLSLQDRQSFFPAPERHPLTFPGTLGRASQPWGQDILEEGQRLQEGLPPLAEPPRPGQLHQVGVVLQVVFHGAKRTPTCL